MFGLSPIRLWIYAGIFLVIAGILAHDKYLGNRLKARTSQVSDLTRDLVNERANYAAYVKNAQAEALLNKVTRETLQARLTDIESQRAPVRLRCTAARLPAAATEGGTATGTAGQAEGSEPETIAFDPGPDLEQYGADCAANTATLITLQEWERGRGH